MGGRYFTIVALCCYGRKCGISDGKIRKDAWELYEFLDSITDDEANHFTRRDMKDALGVLKSPDRMQTVENTRAWIEEKTKIDIPPNPRRKKPLKRDDGTAFQAARMIQNLQDPNGEWRYHGGAPTKAEAVVAYRKANPEASVPEVARALGITRPTVYKWWDYSPEEDAPILTIEEEQEATIQRALLEFLAEEEEDLNG